MLRINDLIVAFETESGELTAIKNVSLSLKSGEILALVGESGCGKTVLCKTILKTLCEKGRIRNGEILLNGKNLVPLHEKEMIAYRGKEISMVFQDPMMSLDPTMPVGEQIAEVIRMSKPRDYARQQAIELMKLVEIDQPQIRYGQMPHQFSGGMRQRIAIAIALAGKPKMLLADEPTTALDQQTQTQILSLLKKTGIATIFVTHDLSLVEDIADRVAIMKDGEIVEIGQVSEIFENPKHDYTKKLLGYLDYGKGRGHNHKAGNKQKGEPIVEVINVSKHFKLGCNKVNKVLDNFNMSICKGEIVGLVGPSGSGKSTLARCIMGMYPVTSGDIVFNRAEEMKSNKRNWKQMIFQDSVSAFNPRMTIGEIIAEPLKVSKMVKKSELRSKVTDLMKQVELDTEIIDRYPHEVSGGQRQRAAIARAISVDPEFIVADEPVSSLDISTQAQIIHLFRKLQEERNLTILLISHDIPMINHVSDRIIAI